jgi:hypothetical protein
VEKQVTINLFNFAGHSNLFFMKLDFFLQVIKGLIFRPVEFWQSVKDENPSGSLVGNSLLLPFSMLISLSAFAGSIIFSNTHLAAIYSFLYGIQCFAVIFISVYLTALIIGLLSGPLSLEADFKTTIRLIAFSLVPFFLCQLLSRLFESFQFVNILGLYGLYIFWIGAETLLNPTETGKRSLLIATFLTFILTYFLSDLLLGSIIDKLYFAHFA